MALSRLSSFQLSSRLVVSALASSSPGGLVALSMSCRRVAQMRAPEAWAAQQSPRAKQTRSLGGEAGASLGQVPPDLPLQPSPVTPSGAPGGAGPAWPYPLHSQGGDPQHGSPAHTQHQAGVGQEEVHSAAQHVVLMTLPLLLGELCHVCLPERGAACRDPGDGADSGQAREALWLPSCRGG